MGQLRSVRSYADATPEQPDYSAIAHEVGLQFRKWGSQRRTLFEWLTYLTEELGETAAAIGDYEYDRLGALKSIYDELTQVGALAVHVMAVVRTEMEALAGMEPDD